LAEDPDGSGSKYCYGSGVNNEKSSDAKLKDSLRREICIYFLGRKKNKFYPP
jgi:hypothetical protein